MKLLGIFVIFWVFVGVNSYGASIKSQIQEIKQWQKRNALYPKDNFFSISNKAYDENKSWKEGKLAYCGLFLESDLDDKAILKKLQSIERLVFDEECPIDSLPDAIRLLENLKGLRIQNANLKALNPHIFSLKYFQDLNVAHNEITEIPQNICEARNLMDLELSHNKISTLPSCLFNQRKSPLYMIEWDINPGEGKLPTSPRPLYLKINHNKLTSLPDTIKDIIELEVSHNQLQSLPHSIENMRFLDISYNKLTSLPLDLAKIDYVNYEGNKIVYPKDFNLSEDKSLRLFDNIAFWDRDFRLANDNKEANENNSQICLSQSEYSLWRLRRALYTEEATYYLTRIVPKKSPKNEAIFDVYGIAGFFNSQERIIVRLIFDNQDISQARAVLFIDLRDEESQSKLVFSLKNGISLPDFPKNLSQDVLRVYESAKPCKPPYDTRWSVDD